MDKKNKQTRTTSSIIGMLIIVIGLGVIVYLINHDAQLHQGNSRTITFSIESSSGMAEITLTDSTSQISYSGMASTPWQKSAIYKSGDQVYLTAGNPSQYGSLTCSITINGAPWKSDRSDSPQDKVGCAGIVP